MISDRTITGHRRNGAVTVLLKKIIAGITPFQLLVAGYMAITLTGALLLSLPVSAADGRSQPFIDSLFIATSGISTSGLSMVSIGEYYTRFGQTVLLLIFQIGGIGYMTIIIFLTHALGLKTSLLTQVVAQESLAGSGFRTLGRFFLATVFFTLLFEILGALVLAWFWHREMPLGTAVFFGVFHSVSAFCTAGFGLYGDSLMGYGTSTVMNVTINIISVAGGLGFFVLFELYLVLLRWTKRRPRRRVSLHTKLVIAMTAIVMIAGSALILSYERWDPALSTADRIMLASFQAISASTTDGFNSMDIAGMSVPSIIVLMALMFVGASPGSTGGGIKTTTLGIIIMFLFYQLKGREDTVNLMERRIPVQAIMKAFGVFTWFITIIMIDAVVMCGIERAGFLPVLFEIISAMGNTGLSMGITSSLSVTGKIMLIFTMFAGRVGPLTLGFFLAGAQEPLPYRYPEGEVFIG
jgi:trk system potassium uptake protein